MKRNPSKWTKAELHTYILLLCANADRVERSEELAIIKSKTDPATFKKVYKEFSGDTQDSAIDKIEDSMRVHEYSDMELAQLRKEIQEVFLSDHMFMNAERNLDRILRNIIY